MKSSHYKVVLERCSPALQASEWVMEHRINSIDTLKLGWLLLYILFFYILVLDFGCNA